MKLLFADPDEVSPPPGKSACDDVKAEHARLTRKLTDVELCLRATEDTIERHRARLARLADEINALEDRT